MMNLICLEPAWMTIGQASADKVEKPGNL